MFGGAEHEELEKYDPERLERQNDAEIEGISERAKHLKEARRVVAPTQAWPLTAALCRCLQGAAADERGFTAAELDVQLTARVPPQRMPVARAAAGAA